jgi:hypothetical protein
MLEKLLDQGFSFKFLKIQNLIDQIWLLDELFRTRNNFFDFFSWVFRLFLAKSTRYQQLATRYLPCHAGVAQRVGESSRTSLNQPNINNSFRNS